MKYLFDTNAVINFVCDIGNFSALQNKDKYYISFITFIELSVGFRTKNEKIIIQRFLKKVKLILIDEKLIKTTINIRKEYKLKLPDAIIVSTAICENATLITSDQKILSKSSKMNLKTYDPLSFHEIKNGKNS